MKIKAQEYEWTFDEQKGTLKCTRNGKEWRDETGDGAILCLLQKVVDYKKALEVLAVLGNEPHLGNSIGNKIAQHALLDSK